jgi:hypothetical protein
MDYGKSPGWFCRSILVKATEAVAVANNAKVFTIWAVASSIIRKCR